jgi:hypothetical protein
LIRIAPKMTSSYQIVQKSLNKGGTRVASTDFVRLSNEIASHGVGASMVRDINALFALRVHFDYSAWYSKQGT